MEKYSAILVYFLFVFSSINLMKTQNITNDPSLEIIRHEDAEEGLYFKTDVTENSHLQKERKLNEIPDSEHLKEAHKNIAISEHTAQYNHNAFNKEEHTPEKVLLLEHKRINNNNNEAYNKLIQHSDEKHNVQLPKTDFSKVSNNENGEESLTSYTEFSPSDLPKNEEQVNIMNKEQLNETNEVFSKSENEESVEDHTVQEVHEIISSTFNELNNENELDVYQENLPEILPEEKQELEKFGSSEETINAYIYQMPPNVEGTSIILDAITETYWYDKEHAKQIPWNEKDEKDADENQGFEKQSWSWSGTKVTEDLNAQEKEENGEKEKDMILELVEPPGYFSDIQTTPVKAAPFPKTQPKEDDICSLLTQTGPCKAYLLRYFYNSKVKECEHFVYGGCQGNANNFKTLAECTIACVKVVHT